ncbi:hypothetical protein PLESTF_000321900 [Pleodorina starrii]|nr:hypothetical protein PLESTF_000321900 [Pleodorina starrii]
MQQAMKATGLQRAGPKTSRLSSVQRGNVVVRSCVQPSEGPGPREQQALAVASFLSSTIVALASTSPALADEAIAVAVAPAAVEAVATSAAAIDGSEALAAPALEAAEDTPLAVASAAPVVAEVEAEVEAEVVPVAVTATATSVPETDAAPATSAELVEVEVEAEVEAAAPSPAPVQEDTEAAISAPAEVEVAVGVAVEAQPVAVISPVATEEEEVAEGVIGATAVAEEGAAAPAVAQAEAVEAVKVEAVEAAAAEVSAEAAADMISGAGQEVVVAEATEAAAEVVAVEELPGAVETAPLLTLATEEVVAEEVAEVVATPEAAPELTLATQAAEPTAAAAAAEAEAQAASGVDLRALLAGAASLAPAPAPAPASGSEGSEGPSAETLTYGALGAAAASFVATFFVAPRFKEAFKEPVDWRDMYAALTARGVRSVTPEEAYAKAKKGAVLLDVRLAERYSARSPLPSTNVPLYQPIAGWDPASNIRRAGFAFFGIFGTELNPNFMEEVAAKVPKNKEVIVMCETGGSLENKPGTQFGFQSRSLKAVYYLQQAGYGKVLHMKGGLGDWSRAGLPLSDDSADEQQQQPQSAARTARGGTSSGSVKGSVKGSVSSKAAAKELVSATTRGRK